MLSYILLFLPLASGGADSHAALHPEDAEFYLEVPDPGALAEVFAQAPMTRTVQEPSVASFLEMLDVDPIASTQAIGKMIVPPEDLTPIFKSLRSCSISLSYGDDLLDSSSVGVQAILDLSSAEMAASVSKGLLQLAGAPDPTALSAAFQLDLLPGIEFWSFVNGDRLVVGGGQTTRESFDGRADDSQPGLDSSEAYDLGTASLAEEKGQTILRINQLRSPVETLVFIGALLYRAQSGEAAPIEEIPDALLLLNGTSHLRMQAVGGRYLTEVFCKEKEDASRILGHRAVDKTWLDPVPEDVMAFYSTSLDSAALTQLLRTALSASAEMPPEMATALEDLISRTGPGMLGYMFPISGIGLPSTFLWLDLNDAEGFTEEVVALLEELSTHAPGLSAKTRDYRPRSALTGERARIPVTTVTLPEGMLDMGPMLSLSPTFAVLEDRILIGISSMSVKRELKRIYASDDAADATATHPMRTSGCELPEGALSVFWMDWASFYDGIFSLVRSLTGLMGAMGGDELPFDPNALPDAKVFTQHMRPTFHYSRRIESGIFRHHEASFGPETWVGMMAVAMEFGGIAGDEAVTEEPEGLEHGGESGGEHGGEHDESEHRDE